MDEPDGIDEQVAALHAGVERYLAALEARADRWQARLGGWTPRDVTAHLVGWNRYVVRGCRQLARGELPFYDVDPGEGYAKVNAAIVREVATTDRTALVGELRASAADLAAYLRGLDVATWARDSGVRHAGEALTIAGTVAELVRDYSHHARQLDEWRV